MGELPKTDSEQQICGTYDSKSKGSRDSDRGIEILLDQNKIEPGSNLSGQVILKASKSSPEEITLKIYGISTINLPTDYGKAYSSKDTHLYEKICLLSKRDKQNGQIEELRYPFEFRMPELAPPAFKGQHVKIAYSCVASAKFSDVLARRQIASREFYVTPAKLTDLGSDSSDLALNSTALNKTFRPFPVLDPAGPVEISIQIDKLLVDRENNSDLSLSVEVKNHSRYNLNNLKYGVIQIVKSSAKRRQILEKVVLKQFDSDKFRLKSNQSWNSKKVVSFNELKEGDEKGDVLLPPSMDYKCAKFECQIFYCVFVTLIPPDWGTICELYFPVNLV